MSTCAIDCEHFVEIGEFGSVVRWQRICTECGRRIPQGRKHYQVREYETEDDLEDGNHHMVFSCCEECGDLALSWLELGYCWNYGHLKSDIAEMNA